MTLDELKAFFLVDGANYMRYTPTSDDVNYDMHDTECTDEVLELVAKSGEQLEYSVRKQGELEGEIFGLQDRVKELESALEGAHLEDDWSPLLGFQERVRGLEKRCGELENECHRLRAENAELREFWSAMKG